MQTCCDGHNFKVAKRSQLASMLVLGTYDVVNCDQHVERLMFNVTTNPHLQRSKKHLTLSQCLLDIYENSWKKAELWGGRCKVQGEGLGIGEVLPEGSGGTLDHLSPVGWWDYYYSYYY